MKALVYGITLAALGGFCLGVLVMYLYDVLMKRSPAKSTSDTSARRRA